MKIFNKISRWIKSILPKPKSNPTTNDAVLAKDIFSEEINYSGTDSTLASAAKMLQEETDKQVLEYLSGTSETDDSIKDRLMSCVSPPMTDEKKNESINRLSQDATDRFMKGIAVYNIPNKVVMDYMTALKQSREKLSVIGVGDE